MIELGFIIALYAVNGAVANRGFQFVAGGWIPGGPFNGGG